MSFSLGVYNNKKDQIIQELDQLYLLLNEMDSTLEKQKLNEIINHIKQENFQIVVVGEFSRGKSTFVNALLGKILLPASSKPTTALLNIIKYSKEPHIDLHYHDKNQPIRRIDEANFKEFVAPMDPIQGDKESEDEYRGKVNELKKIMNAEIGHPLSFCEGGVTLIDTPGTNDLDEAREQITNSIIPRSDAAIFLLSARKILSESEVSFLRDRLLSNDIQKVFIVVNFKDALETSEEIEKVQRYAYENLKEILKEPKIFMISAKHALNAKRKMNGEELKRRGRPLEVWDLDTTGLPELENALSDFLMYERGKVKLVRPIKRTEKLIKEIYEKKIQFEKIALAQEKEGLREKVEAFKPKLAAIQQIGNEALRNISLQMSKQEQLISTWYENELQKVTDEGIQAYEENQYLNIQDIRQKVEARLGPLERALHTKKMNKMTDAAKMVIENQSKELNQEWIKLEKDLVKMNLPDNTQTENSLVLHTGAPSVHNNLSIFDDILEGLDNAWERSDSFIGKLAIGAGFVATAVVGTAVFLFNLFSSWVAGDTEKMKFKRDLMNQFEETKKKRRSSFQQEWRSMVKTVDEQYKTIINENVQQMEQQLKLLIDSTEIDGAEIQRRLDILERRGARLLEIEKSILRLYSEIDRKHAEKVEMFS